MSKPYIGTTNIENVRSTQGRNGYLPLPTVHRANRLTLIQVKRNESVAMYRGNDSASGKDERLDYLEVFVIKRRGEETIRGKVISAREKYPGNEAFGKYAKTFRPVQYDQAEAYYNYLTDCKEKGNKIDNEFFRENWEKL